MPDKSYNRISGSAELLRPGEALFFYPKQFSRHEKGLPLLNRAYELGADEALLCGIASYVERSGMGEKTDEKSE